MRISVKICGVNSAAAADAALAAGADYAGLVFHPASPRHLALEQAASLASRLRGRIRLVALLADADDGLIERVVASVRPDFLQLHGTESVERAAFLRAHFGVPVIKALPVAEAADLGPVSAYEQVCDMLLFDAKAPAGASRSGGHGAAFDWRLLEHRKFNRDWLLAGGLTPANVAQALLASGARGVDVSSGVESAPGVKDSGLIRAFIAAARGSLPARAAEGVLPRD